ncbi:hypothetical protein ScalyP_jg5032 [Parmales sp. scaly parma]|nr:hypothetical protein ScalyP_jg5032 [Parmales sp. scaly parma]
MWANFLLCVVCSSAFINPAPQTSELLQKANSYWKINFEEEISTLPRFREFCENHDYFTRSLHTSSSPCNGVTNNILRGGEFAGPIAKSGVDGQFVRALGFFGGLPATPRINYHADKRLSFINELQKSESLSTFQQELHDVLRLKEGPDLFKSLGEHQSSPTGWEQITLINHFSEQTDSTALFPKTMRLLDEHCGERLGPRHTAIARQLPHSGIAEHNDLYNWMSTLHLPLLHENENGGRVGLIVSGEKGTIDWEVGVASVMDTSFSHSTYNNSPTPMYLLLVDFFHIDLSQEEVRAIKKFFKDNSK